MPKRIRRTAEIRRRNRPVSETTDFVEAEKRRKRPHDVRIYVPEEQEAGWEDATLRRAGYEYLPDPMGRLDRGTWTDRDGRPLTSVARNRILRDTRRPARPDRGPAIPPNVMSPEDGEILDDGPGARRPEEETDVALAPLAIPAVAFLARLIPPAIAAYRASRLLPPLAENIPSQLSPRDGEAETGQSNRVATDPGPQMTPPFPGVPPEGSGGGRHETPAGKVEGGALVNPIPPGLRPEATVTIFPDQSEMFPDLFYEDRRGTEPTRIFNSHIRDLVERLASESGYFAKHAGGARNRKGVEVAETWLRPAGAEKGQRRGGSYIDITFKSEKSGRRLFINTVDTRADGSTPTTRELNAMTRIFYNSENGDLYVMIPKLGDGQNLDEDALREFLDPILRELDRDKPDIDPRSGKGPDDLVHRFKHG